MLVTAFVFSGSAFAADNTGCLTCHAAPVGSAVAIDMPVPDVDRNSACGACHLTGFVGSHPYHQPGADCGAACHPGWGDTLMTAVPSYTDPVSGAAFASSTSKSSSPAVLHIIHSAPRWPAGVSTTVSECGSCHAAAACAACHTGAVSAEHTDHSATGNGSYPAYPGWTGTVGYGVSGGDQTQNSVTVESNQCASAGCHDLAGTASNRPRLVEDYNYAVGVNPDDPTGTNTAISLVGTWRLRTGSQYSGSRMSYNNVLGSSLTASFTGSRVDLVSDKDPYRGKADVYLDGAKVATIDCYSATTVYQAVVYSSATLTNGPHTLQVRPLNQKNSSARAAYVVVDSFRVYTALPASIAPACVDCHSDKATGHGGDFNHEATHTVGVYAGFACTDCHSLSMFTEHARTSSSSKPASCTACHVAYAPFNLISYDFTCGGTGTTIDGAAQPCHNNAGEQRHDFVDSNHDASGNGAASDDCRGCHGSDLAIVHTEGSARAYNAQLAANSWSVSCLSCHGTTKYPATKDCTSSACHGATGGSGVVSMATHPAPPHNGTNSGQSDVPRTGGFSCSTCHSLEAVGEHAKTSSVGAGGEIGCMDCHTAAYFPAGWLAVPGTSNTCTACHPVAGGEAGAPHEAAEYTSKHNYSTIGLNPTSCGSTTMSCHSGTTALLGDMADAAALHAPWKPGDADCTSCHVNNTTLPTKVFCGTCHTVGHDTIPAHNSTSALFAANAECLACHTGYTNLMFGHPFACTGCHDNATLTAGNTRYLEGTFTPQCTSCHTAAVLGALYSPADPNHYDPYLASHTAASMNAAAGNKVCTDCHAATLKSEHVFTLSSGAVDCVDCHTSTVPVAGAAQVAAGWSNDLCSDCHGANHGATGLTAHSLVGNGGCSGADCHANTDDLAVLHLAAADTSARTSCNVCHTSGADTSLSTVDNCMDCHDAHNLAVHSVATDTGHCLRCHEKADGTAATDTRDIHPTCGTCHQAGAVPGGLAGKGSDCVNCHAAGVLPEPHAAAAGAYSPYDPKHYVGTEAIHTGDGADTGYGNTGGFACSSCHLLEMKPEHAKVSSAFSTVPGTHADLCVACHETKVDGFGVTAWNKRCVACHATAASHTAYAGEHDVSATWGATCGGGGCHDTANAAAIHANSLTTNATVTTCLNTCHTTNNAVPATAACDACHSGEAHNHELDAATSIGCANTGAGCHPVNSTDYTDYHANKDQCTNGLCHRVAVDGAVNPSKATHPNPNGCTDCHDGTYVNAADASGLLEPTPTGHYPNALHDIGAFLGVVKGTSGGVITATCNDCHSRTAVSGVGGLYKQHQGLGDKGDVTCAECHNAYAAVVADNWSTPSCGDCHTGPLMPDPGDTRYAHAGSVAPAGINGTGSGCVTTGCHATWDLHVLHEGDGVAPEPACSVCHDYSKQGAKPTKTACGSVGCHDGTPTHPGEDAAHDATGNDTGLCVSCHEVYDIRTIHVGGCDTCHNGGTNLGGDPANTADCVDCHNATDDGYDYGPYDPNHYDAWTASHQATQTIDPSKNWGTTSYSRTLLGWMGNTISYEVPCQDCHTTDLMAEHTKNTISFSTVPGSYANYCVACHEAKVDTFTANWDGTCGGESGSCHNMGTTNLHFGVDASKSWVGKHDATNVMLPSPGSLYSDVIGGSTPPAIGAGFTDGFESGNTSAWTTADYVPASGGTVTYLNQGWETNNFTDPTTGGAWARSSTTYVTISTTAPTHTGTYHARLSSSTTASTRTLTSPVYNTSGFTTSRSISFWYRSAGLDAGDTISVAYSTDGTNYTNYLLGPTTNLNTGTYTQVTGTLPASNNLTLRFSLQHDTDGLTTYFYVDDIVITGTSPVVAEKGWKAQSTTKQTGTYAAQAIGGDATTRYLAKTGIDTSGASTVNASWAASWSSLEVADSAVVQTYDGSTWTTRKTYTLGGSQAWMSDSLTGLPADTVGIRFAFRGDTADDLFYVDDVSVQPVAVAGPPAGSAGASCQANPNGTECHNVADVANIHSELADYGCPVCHTGNATNPTTLNCQSAACHASGGAAPPHGGAAYTNIDEHDVRHHATTFETTAFDSAFTSTWCSGCHIAGIDDDHETLKGTTYNGTSIDYQAKPCSVCHKKSADTTAAFAVTAANTSNTIASRTPGTALCFDCHKTFTKTRPHVQRGTVDGIQFTDATAWTGHRVYATNLRSGTWMETAWLASNGTSYSATRPGVTAFLAAGWQDYAAMVTCDDCHSSSGTPHAATMAVKIDPNYAGDYQALALRGTGSTENAICKKCHASYTSSNVAHAEGGHSGSDGLCIVCHPKVPHQTKHVRMLGDRDEGALGTDGTDGNRQIRPHNVTTPATRGATGWDTGDCSSGCYADHNYSSTGTNW